MQKRPCSWTEVDRYLRKVGVVVVVCPLLNPKRELVPIRTPMIIILAFIIIIITVVSFWHNNTMLQLPSHLPSSFLCLWFGLSCFPSLPFPFSLSRSFLSSFFFLAELLLAVLFLVAYTFVCLFLSFQFPSPPRSLNVPFVVSNLNKNTRKEKDKKNRGFSASTKKRNRTHDTTN